MRNAFAAVIVVGTALTAVAFSAQPAKAQVAGFVDVPKDHWAADSVGKLAKTGIIQGSSAKPLGVAVAQAKSGKASAKPAYDGEKPVTRYELAVTLWRMVQYLDMADKQKKGTTHAMAAPANVDGATAIRKLIAAGYLPAKSPIASNGGKVVTANQFADAIAFVASKIREKATPITPGSLKTMPIDKPDGDGHTHSHDDAPST